MFKLEVMVEDKSVVGVMKALNGKVVGEPKWREVIGAIVEQVAPETTVIKADGLGTTLPVRVANYLLANTTGPTVKRTQVVEAIKRMGGQPNSISYVLQQMALHKAILKSSGGGKGDNAIYALRRSNGNGHHAMGA